MGRASFHDNRMRGRQQKKVRFPQYSSDLSDSLGPDESDEPVKVNRPRPDRFKADSFRGRRADRPNPDRFRTADYSNADGADRFKVHNVKKDVKKKKFRNPFAFLARTGADATTTTTAADAAPVAKKDETFGQKRRDRPVDDFKAKPKIRSRKRSQRSSSSESSRTSSPKSTPRRSYPKSRKSKCPDPQPPPPPWSAAKSREPPNNTAVKRVDSNTRFATAAIPEQPPEQPKPNAKAKFTGSFSFYGLIVQVLVTIVKLFLIGWSLDEKDLENNFMRLLMHFLIFFCVNYIALLFVQVTNPTDDQVPFYWQFLLFVESIVVFGIASLPTLFISQKGRAYMTLGSFCIMHVICALFNILAAYLRKRKFRTRDKSIHA